MKTLFFRFTWYAIIVYLTCLDLALAAPQPSGGDVTHFCGFDHWQGENRHFARTLAANLNVGEPRTVRTIYFLPNDRPYRADVVQRIKDEILSIEADPQGEPMVHRVDGQHPDSHYLYDTLGTVHDEIKQAFDLSANIYFIVIDNSIHYVNSNGVDADGFGPKIGNNGGFSFVPDEFHWTVVTHELGHNFGLLHDFRDQAYIMSYSKGSYKSLSTCSAEFLAVNPYFNPDIPIEEGVPPTIELISPSKYSAGSERVSVQLALNDSEELHQVFLFEEGAPSFGERLYQRVWDCRGLAGEKDAIVEFNYDGGRGMYHSLGIPRNRG